VDYKAAQLERSCAFLFVVSKIFSYALLNIASVYQSGEVPPT
jgi:hypothetical protein